MRPLLSLVVRKPVLFGVVIGVVFGAWNIGYSLLSPLAEDTVLALVSFYGPMFVMPGIAGFAAYRATGRWLDVIKTAVIVAVVTQLVFGAANMVRVNLLLDTLRLRSDWQSLVARFEGSGFESFRAYVNYDYSKQILPKLLAVSVIGGVCGMIGAVLAKASLQDAGLGGRQETF